MSTTINIEKEYELMLDQVDNLVQRRQSVTATYLSVNTAITGSVAFLLKDGSLAGTAQESTVLLLMVCGCVICSLWRRLIEQCSQLLDWWYGQLRDIESQMNGAHKMFTEEYNRFYAPTCTGQPIGATKHEVDLSKVFTAVYCLVGAAIFIKLIWSYVRP